MIYATWTLAGITLIYVILIYKTLSETTKMAKATQDLAQSSRRPNLVIADHFLDDNKLHWHQVSNIGSGVAKDIKLSVGDTDVPMPATVLHPGGITRPIDALHAAHEAGTKLKLSCTDIQGEAYEFPYEYSRHRGEGWFSTAPEEPL